MGKIVRKSTLLVTKEICAFLIQHAKENNGDFVFLMHQDLTSSAEYSFNEFTYC
jgi:hypothetical protein